MNNADNKNKIDNVDNVLNNESYQDRELVNTNSDKKIISEITSNFKKVVIPDRTNRPFAQIDNEVLTNRIAKLTPDEKVALIVMLSLPNTWYLHLAHFNNMCNLTAYRSRKARQGLVDKGFLERTDVRKNGRKAYEYVVYELPRHIMKEMFLGTENKSQNLTPRKQAIENVALIYNNNKEEIINKEDKKEFKNKNPRDVYLSSSKTVSNDIHNMSHDSIITESFSNNHDLHDKQSHMQSFSNSIKNNNSSEKIQPDSEIRCKDNKKGRKTKAEQLKEIYHSIIQERESDPELQELLCKFFTVYIDTKRTLHEFCFNGMLKRLERLSEGDIFKKRFIVQASIENGWLGFYELKQDYEIALTKAKEKTKWDAREEEDIDCSALWLDENGNPVKI